MKKLPTHKVLKIKPKEYLEQGFSHCGAYAVKGILSAFDLDDKTHPKYYHPHWFGRLTGWTLGKNYYVNILRSYGINATRGSVEYLSGKEKIEFLKQNLSQDKPIMIRIGNGYLTDTYNPILGKLVSHWITLWGYDDEKELFYVYDSGLRKKHWNSRLPIGNTTRTYHEILRDWGFGLWQPIYWLTVGRDNYLYVCLKS